MCSLCSTHGNETNGYMGKLHKKMSKQIRWKEAADLQSLGCFQDSGHRFSAAEDNVNQAG